jgi:uncharacterized protein YbjT (DUF2867 family)
MAGSRVLVAGATGQLGRVVTLKLVAAGIPVRALARRPDPLAALGPDVETAAIDLLDLAGLTEACRGVDQIVATANNNMGKGPTSPSRTDLAAYQNLCAAARTARVRRLIYVSFRGMRQDAPVDIFRIKWYIEDAIRRSGVPFVMLRPTAFMDIWIDEILAKGMREKGVATIFGSGDNVGNYIAVDDVAEFAVRIAESSITNEVVEAGGPSDVTMNQLTTLLERRLNKQVRRRHIPVVAMRLLPPIVRPFNEVAARMMTLGLYAATQPQAFPGWKASADRLGVSPQSVETYIDSRF